MTAQRTIFAACKSLGIDHDARRDLQLRLVGKASLTEMSEAEREIVAAHLRAQSKGQARRGKHPAAPRGDLRLVHLLWSKLGAAGHLTKPGRDGLNAFVRTRFGEAWGTVPADIDMLRDAQKINEVVEALKSWMRRERVPFDWTRTGRR